MGNMVTFYNCCSYQAIIDRNLELGRTVEKASKMSGKGNYFYKLLSLILISRAENRNICNICT